MSGMEIELKWLQHALNLHLQLQIHVPSSNFQKLDVTVM